MEKLSRRSFFRLLGGGVAAAVVAPKLLLDKIIDIPVEYGWTWYVDKTKLPGGPQSTFAGMITKTLRANSQRLQENIATKNVFLIKLKTGEKAQLRITKISPEEQTKRMTARLEERFKDRNSNYTSYRIRSKPTKSPFYEGYEDPVKKFAPDCYECQQKLEDIV